MMFKRKGCEKALCSRFFLVLLKAVVLPWFFFNPFLALSPLIHPGCPIDCISSIEKIKGEKKIRVSNYHCIHIGMLRK